jgi:hypothetical protein
MQGRREEATGGVYADIRRGSATMEYETHGYFRGPEPCFRKGEGIDGVLLGAALIL